MEYNFNNITITIKLQTSSNEQSNTNQDVIHEK